MIKNVNKKLQEYINMYIIPQYADFDLGHNTEHVLKVIGNSFNVLEHIISSNIISKEEAEQINIDMVYTIAAYHDIAMPMGRKNHHINSGRILKADDELWNFFEKEELDIMRDAIEDHRASNPTEPRTIYGKIISEADRDIDPISVFRRAFLFNDKTNNNNNETFDFMFNRAINHIQEKYGEHGYIKLWLNYPVNTSGLNELRRLLNTPEEAKELCKRFYSEE